jgi:MFS family permease
LFNLAAALVSYPAGLLSDRWGRRDVLLVALLIFVVAYIGIALATGRAAIAALFVFYGLYQGIFRSVGKALAADLVPEPLRASGIGWYSTTVGLLQLAASIIAGLLWDGIAHTAVFYYGAAVGALGCVALVALVPRRPPSRAVTGC